MEAKEKAESLVKRFIYRRTDYVEIEDAKQCALIATDEILGYMVADRGIEFWQEVKIEIEKL